MPAVDRFTSISHTDQIERKTSFLHNLSKFMRKAGRVENFYKKRDEDVRGGTRDFAVTRFMDDPSGN